MTSYEKLTQANLEYHTAIEEIFCVTGLEIDPEELTEIKSELGDMSNKIFKLMGRINKLLQPYYGGS